jgi:aldose 1-epimerase
MSTPDDVLVLANDRWRVGVRPSVGAVVAFGQIHSNGGWVDLLAPTPFLGRANASFPLLPWSNRIGGAVVSYRGRTWHLRHDWEQEDMAIHGVARDYPWQVTGTDTTGVTLAFDSAGLVGVNWPWQFRASVDYRLNGPDFRVTTTLHNSDGETFPAGFGHHPYFWRTLQAHDDEVRLELPYSAAFELREGLAQSAPVPVDKRLDFRVARGFGSTVALDDCLTSRLGDAPNRLTYPASGREIEIHADPLYSRVVVYVPQGGQNVFAVEPVTNANNGFDLFNRGIPGSGVFELPPGGSATASFTIRVAQ